MVKIGSRVVEIRPMTASELSAEGWGDWDGIPVVIVLNDGTKLYASRDGEGNGPGVLVGTDASGSFSMMLRRA